MEYRLEKYVNNLPAVLVANTLYYVKTGAGFDLYLTNNTGTIIAYPLNVSSGATTTYTTTEVNLGTSKRSGSFTITSTNLVVGKQVLIYQATGPYTNKGTLADEAEMDFIGISGVVVNTTTIKCYWNSRTAVRGNFKFNYLVNT